MRQSNRRDLKDDGRMPRIDRWLMGGFEQFFLPRYLRKHFHSLAVNRQQIASIEFASQDAMVVYANHASWWDPMTALYMRSRLFPSHGLYAPIDAEALSRYRIFKRMGFYGISKDTRRGAVDFLRSSLRIASQGGTGIWLTPEGRFCDARDNNTALMPGLAHLAAAIEQTQRTTATATAASSRRVWFLSAAVEYVFWEERLPECLCWFGEPSVVEWGKPTMSKAAWDETLTSSLRSAQKQLATASIARDSAAFEVLLRGGTGSWRLYDSLRRNLARLRGQKLSLEHGSKLNQH